MADRYITPVGACEYTDKVLEMLLVSISSRGIALKRICAELLTGRTTYLQRMPSARPEATLEPMQSVRAHCPILYLNDVIFLRLPAGTGSLRLRR
jgi:hypothetical protein